MPDAEVVLECPVCPTVRMGKMSFARKNGPTLDFCPRCGGIWFDRGEVALMKRLRPRTLCEKMGQTHAQNLLLEAGRSNTGNASEDPKKLLQPPEAFYEKYSYRAPCRKCRTPFDRNSSQCPTCKRENRIECPLCRKLMTVAAYGNFRLDYCENCMGVWFDNIELGAIWNEKTRMSSSEAAVTKSAGFKDDCNGPGLLVNILASDPSIVLASAEVSLEIGKTAYENIGALVSDVPQSAGAVAETTFALAGSAAESAGELSGEVFETVVEIIAGIFS